MSTVTTTTFWATNASRWDQSEISDFGMATANPLPPRERLPRNLISRNGKQAASDNPKEGKAMSYQIAISLAAAAIGISCIATDASAGGFGFRPMGFGAHPMGFGAHPMGFGARPGGASIMMMRRPGPMGAGFGAGAGAGGVGRVGSSAAQSGNPTGKKNSPPRGLAAGHSAGAGGAGGGGAVAAPSYAAPLYARSSSGAVAAPSYAAPLYNSNGRPARCKTDSKQTDSKQTDSKQTDSEQTDCKKTDSKQTDSKPQG
jgi:hypothetical protein